MDDEREMVDDDSEQATPEEIEAEDIGHTNRGIDEWLKTEEVLDEDDDIEGDEG